MTAPDLKYMSLADAALEPIEGETSATPPSPAEPASNARSVFHPNTRNHVKSERRLEAERRVMLRFEEERRKGIDRRPRKSWERDKNL